MSKMALRSEIDERRTRQEAQGDVDEFTAQIPSKCHVAVLCGLDNAGHRVWIGKTAGRLKVVTEESTFINDGIRYDSGDKYFVVEYYQAKKKNLNKPVSPDNIILGVYTKSKEKCYVPNHLILRHHDYGFDMPYKTHKIADVSYEIPAHDRELIDKLIEGGNAFEATLK